VNKLTEMTMGNLKKYILLLIIILPAIIAVVLRSTGYDHFRYDAARWAKPSVNGSNIITPAMLTSLKGDILLINLSGNPVDKPGFLIMVNISADSVMTNGMMKKIGKHKGPVVLRSDDPALAARIWMLMSQSGISDLYILSPDSLNETINEKFRADTLIRPEL
jgi:hypothetical protein